MARIAVFGLGYVGSVSVAALAECGHEIVGVDANPVKVEMISAGRSPVMEEGIDALLCEGVEGGLIRTTGDVDSAVGDTDLAIVCVGTPSRANGSLDLGQVERVCREIGDAISRIDRPYTVVIRSTMLPGSMREVVIPTLEQASGRRAGETLGVCVNPEFLREGSSVFDFYHPPFTLIGCDDPHTAEMVAEIYDKVEAELLIVPLAAAEMVKYASNAFHAIKVAFANEIGSIAKAHQVDSHQVMSIFARDTKLNVSAAYLKPGYAFGGSCLPKDLRALTYHSRTIDVDTPLLDSVIPANQRHIDRAFEMVRSAGSKRIGVLGFSFKAGTDDLRESPVVELIERLIGKGFQLSLYDRHVSLARLIGANKAYIEREIPHVSSLMRDTPEQVVADSDVIVVGNSAAEFVAALSGARPDQVIIDLVRLQLDTASDYRGICW